MASRLSIIFALTSIVTFATAVPSGGKHDYLPKKSPSCNDIGTSSQYHTYSPKQLQELKPSQPDLPDLTCNSNVTLFLPTIGVGSQNYTCNGTDFVQSIPTSGALAKLYDISNPLMDDTIDADGLSKAVSLGKFNLDESTPEIGLHYFSEADNTPIFNLSSATNSPVIAVKKVSAVDAPNAKRNVAWLFLQDAGNGISSGDLTTVYRVDTFRGVKHRETCTECQTGKQIEKQYVAQYWFYS